MEDFINAQEIGQDDKPLRDSLDSEQSYGDLVNGMLTFEEISNEESQIPEKENADQNYTSMLNWDFLTQDFDTEDLYTTSTHNINSIPYNEPSIPYSDFFQPNQPTEHNLTAFEAPSPVSATGTFDNERQIPKHIVSEPKDCTKKRKGKKQSINSILDFLTSNASKKAQKVKVEEMKLKERSMDYLEYSLKKVKENNSRILQNIEKLNRSLEYAQRKEYQDAIGMKSEGSFSCTVCGKRFVYESGLTRHSLRHIDGLEPPRWQVVWTCIECYQVWPKDDLAYEHAQKQCLVQDINCTREIKTSSLLQCEFCERVFTSIPRLLKHTNNHSSTPNYECSPCNEVFGSYRSAMYHWQNCGWLQEHYKFALIKMLLCNVCDRKFKTYEQLYNHRYKACHFIGKQHGQVEAGGVAMTVYQCEVCSHCLTSVPQLQSHRARAHAHEGHMPLYEHC